jgi:hypothetical protein
MFCQLPVDMTLQHFVQESSVCKKSATRNCTTLATASWRSGNQSTEACNAALPADQAVSNHLLACASKCCAVRSTSVWGCSVSWSFSKASQGCFGAGKLGKESRG